MGYRHYFYALELEQIERIFGCDDREFVTSFVEQYGQHLSDLDISLCDARLTAQTALEDIVAGKCRKASHLYGYVLEVICEHFGSELEAECYCVGDLPFQSLLVANGPPIAIRLVKNDWPQIGFLRANEVAIEIQRIDDVPPVKQLEASGYRHYGRGGPEDAMDDMNWYRETLAEAQDQGMAIVSFRH